MTQPFDARIGRGPDLSFLDEKRYSTQAVCIKGDYASITLVTANAVNQVLAIAKAEHGDIPGHTITVEQVPLR